MLLAVGPMAYLSLQEGYTARRVVVVAKAMYAQATFAVLFLNQCVSGVRYRNSRGFNGNIQRHVPQSTVRTRKFTATTLTKRVF